MSTLATKSLKRLAAKVSIECRYGAKKSAVGMRRLLGDDFETFLYADRN